MSHSLQVLYPAENTSFDHDYYIDRHMALVDEQFGKHIEKTVITKGMAGGPNVPAGFHAIATMVFADKGALDAALAASGPALADIPNFYDGKPIVLIGEVVG